MDAIDPATLAQASHEGISHLAHVLLDIRYMCIFPFQFLLVLVAMLDKATGGDRPISILSFGYRSLCRLDANEVVEWERSAVGSWDAAVKGSSPILATWQSEFQLEMAKYLGLSACVLLLDLTRFFDSIRWAQLMADAVELA